MEQRGAAGAQSWRSQTRIPQPWPRGWLRVPARSPSPWPALPAPGGSAEAPSLASSCFPATLPAERSCSCLSCALCHLEVSRGELGLVLRVYSLVWASLVLAVAWSHGGEGDWESPEPRPQMCSCWLMQVMAGAGGDPCVGEVALLLSSGQHHRVG